MSEHGFIYYIAYICTPFALFGIPYTLIQSKRKKETKTSTILIWGTFLLIFIQLPKIFLVVK